MNTLKIPAVDVLVHLERIVAEIPLDAPNSKDRSFVHWRGVTRARIAMIFGGESTPVKDFDAIRWETDTDVMDVHVDTPSSQIMATKLKVDKEAMERGFAAAQDFLKSLRSSVFISGKSANHPTSPMLTITNKVFIVHGHDSPLKNKVARYISALGLRPIILDEQTSTGLTVIELFEQESKCDFAVVLATGDDLAAKKDELNAKDPEGAIDLLDARARQNVIFELGYFVGRFGRGKVMLITDENVELPSDLAGVVYTLREKWSARLWTELNKAGFNFNQDQIRDATMIGS